MIYMDDFPRRITFEIWQKNQVSSTRLNQFFPIDTQWMSLLLAKWQVIFSALPTREDLGAGILSTSR